MYKNMQAKLFEMLEIMENIGYSHSTIDKYRRYILGYIEYLHEYNLELSVESLSQYSAFLDSACTLTEKNLKDRKNAANRFLMFIETGYYTARTPLLRHQFYGRFGEMLNAFVEDLYRLNLTNDTITSYCRRLGQLNDYLNAHNFSDITAESIVGFYEDFSLSGPSSFAFYSCSTYIRRFLVFCYENHHLSENLSQYVPRGRYIRNQRLPSVYTDSEIKKLIQSIDRSSATGKRDYAMIMMLVCLGMRAHDVVSMKFSDIDWDNSVINLTMSKTEKSIQLPIFPDIGNAIIDWLKHGYRKSDLPYIFQPINGAIRLLSSSTLNSTVNKYLLKSGINTNGRHHGSHALRHSLATRLLVQGEPLPVISAVLGHGDTQVTTVYTSVDIASLRNCALPVPPLKSRIYVEA